MKKSSKGLKILLIATAACLIYGISSGIRANYGVMLNSISKNSGVDYASVSFVLAVGQLTIGIVQPLFGALALKKSNSFVLVIGAIMMAVGLIAIPFCHSTFSLTLLLGIVLSGGTGATAFGIIMGAITPAIGEKNAAIVSGFLPKNVLHLYITAFLLGCSGNATVPPTSSLITKLYGSAKLGILFGTAFLVHQVGAFISGWLGGILVESTGTYNLIWISSMVVSLLAGIFASLVNTEKSTINSQS